MENKEVESRVSDVGKTIAGEMRIVEVKEFWCWACQRYFPDYEFTGFGRHDVELGGCGCYQHDGYFSINTQNKRRTKW
ncbi:MAG: hypothetical protein NT004_06295 [Bacteroidetes bacterium]|nr:hypothetical protein [Bacteroidota bacterium]